MISAARLLLTHISYSTKRSPSPLYIKVHDGPTMPQLTAAEIYAHPEFGKVAWEGKATKEGFVEVAKGRSGGPISISYEIHGTGPNKLVVS